MCPKVETFKTFWIIKLNKVKFQTLIRTIEEKK